MGGHPGTVIPRRQFTPSCIIPEKPGESGEIEKKSTNIVLNDETIYAKMTLKI